MKLTPAMTVVIATVLCLVTALEAWGDSHSRRRRRLQRHDRQSQKQESAADKGEHQPTEPNDASDEPESDGPIGTEGGGGTSGRGPGAAPAGEAASATQAPIGFKPEREFEKQISVGSTALVLALIALFIGARIVSWARKRESTAGTLPTQARP